MLDAPRGAFVLPAGDGVLPDQLLARAIDAGVIDAEPFTIPAASIQPASLDLRLGEVAYRIRCSFLPDRHPVEHRLKDLVIDELDLHGEGAVLETNRPYLIPLKERLSLPAGMRGKANPKSSTGRADVFTRVITDDSARFDEIADGYHGGLWLEVVPLSFPVRVREDLSLNQLRLSVGPRRARPTTSCARFHRHTPLLFRDGAPGRRPRSSPSPTGLFLGLDLRGDAEGRVGYRARDHAALLDMTKVRALDPSPVLGAGAPRGRRPHRADAAGVLPADVRRGRHDPAHPRRRDDRVRPDQRRAADPLRRLLRPRLRVRPRRRVPRLTGRPRGAGPRRAVHDRARPTGLQAHLRAHARASERALRPVRSGPTTSARSRPWASTSAGRTVLPSPHGHQWRSLRS